jgi:hypothetical protein
MMELDGNPQRQDNREVATIKWLYEVLRDEAHNVRGFVELLDQGLKGKETASRRLTRSDTSHGLSYNRRSLPTSPWAAGRRPLCFRPIRLGFGEASCQPAASARVALFELMERLLHCGIAAVHARTKLELHRGHQPCRIAGSLKRQAERARRLGNELSGDEAGDRLLAYAEDLEKRAARLGGDGGPPNRHRPVIPGPKS